MAEPVYRRVVIKLSGEYLAGSQSFGLDQGTVDRIAGDLIAAQKLGTEIAVVLGGGNGNPFFTTDTTAVLRAAEIGAQAVLKATNVDGVYSADPKKDATAKRFDRLTHAQALEGSYKVMDATAFALARETSLPIIVFSIAEPGSIGAILRGTGHGTIVAG